MNRAVSATLLSLCLTALLTVPASAQIHYDPDNNAYFVVGDALMTEHEPGSVVFVGKDNLINFATLPGSIKFTLDYPAQFGASYPLTSYNGVNTYGEHTTTLAAGHFIGAQAHSLNNFDNSTLNMEGGFAFFTWLHQHSTLNQTGGWVGDAVVARDASKVFISGGKVCSVVNLNGSTTNLSGGTFESGEGPYLGLANVSGTVNLFGSGFTLSNTVPGQFSRFFLPAVNGTYSTLTGTLLDGTPVNVTLFLADGQTFNDRGGSSQDNPVLPDGAGNGVFTFTDVASGAWFDPPLVDSFLFTMTDGHLFTGILELPTGFSSAFDVRVGNLLLGSFGAGQAVNFADFGFGSGVGSFSIENIFPGVDAENPQGFPVKLGFNAPFASFTMQGFGEGASAAAPEPGTVGFLLIGIAAAAGIGRKAFGRGV